MRGDRAVLDKAKFIDRFYNFPKINTPDSLGAYDAQGT
jgi:hypothetical protein